MLKWENTPTFTEKIRKSANKYKYDIVLVDKLFHSTKEGDLGVLLFLTIRSTGSSCPRCSPLRIGDLLYFVLYNTTF